MKANAPFDAVFHPVEKRGGCWGWFYQFSRTTHRFESYGDCRTKRAAEERRRQEAEKLALRAKVALIDKPAKITSKEAAAMKAGKTEFDVGTQVRITKIADPEDADLVGLVGAITHPFPGLMVGSSKKYAAGLRVDDQTMAEAYNLGWSRLDFANVNICVGDELEVVA